MVRYNRLLRRFRRKQANGVCVCVCVCVRTCVCVCVCVSGATVIMPYHWQCMYNVLQVEFWKS